MQEDLDSAEIKPRDILSVPPVPQRDHSNQRNPGKKRPFLRPDEIKDHFGELTKIAELANEILVKKLSPYRFCIYKEEAEIFIDLAILNEQGKTGAIRRKKITHEQFFKWIHHIQDGEGFLVDETG